MEDGGIDYVVWFVEGRVTILALHRMLESTKEGTAFSWHMLLACSSACACCYMLGWLVQLSVGRSLHTQCYTFG